jgi:hypothetical protein
MGDKIYTDTPPKCDFCDLPAKVDGKTNQGPWANMCAKHNTLYGCGKLGTGYGQEIKPTSEKPAPVIRDAEDLDMADLNEYIDQILGYSISNFYKIQETDAIP